MKKRTIILLVVSILTISIFFTSNIYATPTKDELQSTYANYLKKYGVIKGYPNGSLKLDSYLTRAEFTTLLVRIMNLDKSVSVTDYLLNFKDVNSNFWAYNTLKIASKKNLIGGYADKTFKPNNNVTYVEALTIAVKALGYGSKLQGSWPNNVITVSKNLNLTQNFKMDNNKKLTRGEVCALLYNTLTGGLNR